MTLLPDLSQAPTHHPDLDALSRLETFLYLTPVVGLLPSMWAIYRCQRNKRQLAVCRLSVLLAFTWLSIYLGLNVGADLSGAGHWLREGNHRGTGGHPPLHDRHIAP